MDYSPALSMTSDMTDEELDRYFATYVPLSHLPTPPPVKEHAIPKSLTSSSDVPSASSHSQTCSAPELQAYATHLANLVPTNVSTHRPHSEAIRGFLERANLPDEVVAFAACVLDALSWRPRQQHAHINPDVIVLAALSLAHGFLVDRLRSTRHWSVRESNGVFSVKEIEATTRAMLQDMDYGLFKIQEDMVQKMMVDMQRPKNVASITEGSERCAEPAKNHRQRTFSINLAGTAIWSHGVQTPEPSP
ncbi:hypothetical protein GQ44DRAFT_615239 [Phaeosphaeriaceae sp. PMI808]|nr:hypothetical protein GQ44DRAFT_615239 [Phaeosphaeriaceae sp. PMI808]